MSIRQSYIVNADNNGETYVVDVSRIAINQNINITRFEINQKSNFMHLKERMEIMLMTGQSYRLYTKISYFFGNNQVKFFQLKI